MSKTCTEREVSPALSFLIECEVNPNRTKLRHSEGDADTIGKLKLRRTALVEIFKLAIAAPCSTVISKADQIERALNRMTILKSRQERLFAPEPLVWISAQRVGAAQEELLEERDCP